MDEPMELIDVVIDVTQELINQGCRHSSGNCPVAKAVHKWISQNMPGYHIYVAVTMKVMWFLLTAHDEDQSIYARTITPDDINDFIHRFDAGLPVKPFKTTVEFTKENSVV